MEKTIGSLSNDVHLEGVQAIPDLTQIARMDPEVKEMIKLIAKYKLRETAVKLINKALKRRRANTFLKPVFFRK